MIHELKIIDPIFTEIPNELVTKIKPAVSYTYEFWTQGRFKKTRREQKKHLIVKNDGKSFLPTGLLPRVQKYLNFKKVKYKIVGELPRIRYVYREPPGITLRPDQKEQVLAALRAQRGILVAPTGTGKTILVAAIICSLKANRILFLMEEKGLMHQTAKEFRKFGIKCGLAGDGYKEFNNDVVLGLRQTVALNLDQLHKFDAVIVDEAHHVRSLDGQYGSILLEVDAPLRLGLTATMQEDNKDLMCVEALLGPTIQELSIEKAAELGILALPKIRIVKTPEDHEIRELRSYAEVYGEAIVHRNRRNRMIMQLAKEYNDENKSVLIMITQIDHMENLLQQGEHVGVNAEIVWQDVDGKTREEIRMEFIEKKILTVIASRVWVEGVNIPNLDVLINASAGKKDLVTLQKIGRGLRRTEDKDRVVIVDFFDPCHMYLIRQFGERVSLYCDKGWL